LQFHPAHEIRENFMYAKITWLQYSLLIVFVINTEGAENRDAKGIKGVQMGGVSNPQPPILRSGELPSVVCSISPAAHIFCDFLSHKNASASSIFRHITAQMKCKNYIGQNSTGAKVARITPTPVVHRYWGVFLATPCGVGAYS